LEYIVKYLIILNDKIETRKSLTENILTGNTNLMQNHEFQSKSKKDYLYCNGHCLLLSSTHQYQHLVTWSCL